MPKRKCDSCGKEKNVSGGKVCSNGHFICSSYNCGGWHSKCPLCKKKLK